jgi:uncharacterized protein (TIGR03083 family)
VVPPCPGWDVRALARHLGGVHRWATRYVAEARTSAIDADLDEIVGRWPDDNDLAAWFVDGHRALLDALTNAPEDLDCFTFLEAPSPLAMWARRQAHETAIHRVDIESAVGVVTPFPATFAADGLDELLTAFITRPGRGPRASSEQRLSVLPVDHPARWTARFDADSCHTDREAGDADVAVAGAVSDLYLWTWNRPTIGEVRITGDHSVAETWKDTVHVRWS